MSIDGIYFLESYVIISHIKPAGDLLRNICSEYFLRIHKATMMESLS